MTDFPSRVTLYEDGVYRWAYDLDMWRNRYLLKLIMKILLLLLGVPTLLVLAMLVNTLIRLRGQGISGDHLMFFIRDDLIVLAVVGGLLVGMILLTLLIYAIAAAAMHGRLRFRFQMDDSAVALVRDADKLNKLNAFGTAVAAVGMAIGKTGDAMRIGSTLAVVNNVGTSKFESARRVKILPRHDLLEMREWFGMNQIFVPGEDYAFVRDFILERIPQKARDRSKAQPGRREP